MKPHLSLACTAIAVAWLAACSSSMLDAQQALVREGFTRIQLTGYRPGYCRDHEASEGFSALDYQGLRVSGVVCTGGTRGPTVLVLEQ